MGFKIDMEKLDLIRTRNFLLKFKNFFKKNVSFKTPYSTLVRAWESVDVAGIGPYTWSDCEQRRGNIGYKILSLAHAKGMTALRRK